MAKPDAQLFQIAVLEIGYQELAPSDSTSLNHSAEDTVHVIKVTALDVLGLNLLDQLVKGIGSFGMSKLGGIFLVGREEVHFGGEALIIIIASAKKTTMTSGGAIFVPAAKKSATTTTVLVLIAAFARIMRTVLFMAPATVAFTASGLVASFAVLPVGIRIFPAGKRHKIQNYNYTKYGHGKIEHHGRSGQ